MKKLTNSFLLSVVLLMGLMTTSCSFLEQTVSDAKVVAAEKITEAIAKTGECSAVSVIQADVNELLKVEADESMVVKALGSEAPEGSQQEGVVSEICKAAANLAIPALLSKGVPDKWECQLTDLSSKVSELASKACGEISI